MGIVGGAGVLHRTVWGGGQVTSADPLGLFKPGAYQYAKQCSACYTVPKSTTSSTARLAEKLQDLHLSKPGLVRIFFVMLFTTLHIMWWLMSAWARANGLCLSFPPLYILGEAKGKLADGSTKLVL